MPKFLLLVLCCCWSTISFGIDLEMEEEISRLKHLSTEEFIEQFPFKEYQKRYSLKEVAQIEHHRNLLQKEGLGGDDFIIANYELYLDSIEIDFKNTKKIRELMKVGELMSASTEYLPDSVWVYMAVGDMIFGKIASSIQTMIDQDALDLDDFNTRYIIERLIDNKYAVNVPTSNWVKLYNYVEEGRWDYIWHKFTSTYKKEFSIAVISFLGFLMACFGFYRFRKKKKLAQLKEPIPTKLTV